jgi:2',3'-cyclic-nucleotide 2'-phosphodiesterase (5'-nucleotidase family)
VDQARTQSEALVQVDAGDLFPALEPDALSRKARLLLTAYGRMGVDALVPGEREFALGPDRLRALANATGVPLLAANLVGADGERAFPAIRLVRTAKWPIGIFGIVEFSEAELAFLSQWGLRTTDPITAARAAVASPRPRCEACDRMFARGCRFEARACDRRACRGCGCRRPRPRRGW